MDDIFEHIVSSYESIEAESDEEDVEVKKVASLEDAIQGLSLVIDRAEQGASAIGDQIRPLYVVKKIMEDEKVRKAMEKRQGTLDSWFLG